jgi:heme oxygenase
MNLKEATAELHSKAEKMEFNQRMFRGELKTEEYIMYLYQQLGIFATIEHYLPLHNDLLRTDRILEDIYELTGIDKDKPYIGNVLPSTNEYLSHLDNLDDVSPHVYLNYLALIYGGQMMKLKTPGNGKMYDFDNMKDCIANLRSTQSNDWAEEVNKGFQYIINILDELQRNA